MPKNRSPTGDDPLVWQVTSASPSEGGWVLFCVRKARDGEFTRANVSPGVISSLGDPIQ